MHSVIYWANHFDPPMTQIPLTETALRCSVLSVGRQTTLAQHNYEIYVVNINAKIAWKTIAILITDQSGAAKSFAENSFFYTWVLRDIEMQWIT